MRVRGWLVISLVFGMGYGLGAGLIPAGLMRMAIKMGGVAALAGFAWQHAPRACRPVALVLALGALGDALIEVDLVAGALAFLAGHCVAVRFYSGWRRSPARWSDRGVAAVLLIGFVGLVHRLNPDPGVAVYATGLGAMVLAAWASVFARDRVALGAVMFGLSDVLLLAHMGVMAKSAVPGLLVWPLYYGGQVLITLGVVGYQGRITAPSASRAMA